MGGRCSIAIVALAAAVASAQQPLQFIGIQSNAEDDRNLRDYLVRKGLNLQTRTMSYDGAVRALANWKDSERYLAHMTPYACVAAEMLGANFEILATYQSKATGGTTYHSIFVVNKADMVQILKKKNNDGFDPDLSDLSRYLQSRPLPSFLYHDKFSTSSYLLPSLYFSDQHVFAISETAGGTIKPILVEKAPPNAGGEYLVQEVADGKAELAAVWEKTQQDAEKDMEKDYRSKVYFIPLPWEIPNDLLVLSRPPKNQPGHEDQQRKDILQAIHDNDWKPKDDYVKWVDIRDAPEAVDALGELRRRAARTPHYVTVQVKWNDGASQTAQDEILRAVENGVRLSGTEFVLYDPDFHKNVDVTWTLEPIHDGAIQLTSQIGDTELIEPQQIPISFMSPSDLTTRVANLVQTRLHRIRYVWAYLDSYPAVIRDLDFQPEDTVMVQRIVWRDPERNDYEPGVPFAAELNHEKDFYKLQLDKGRFPQGPDGNLQFEPMSNVAYRVILKRPSPEMRLQQFVVAAVLSSLVLAALAFAWDLRRKRPEPSGFAQTCRRLADDYHLSWSDRDTKDADVLWCDPALDKLIQRFSKRTALIGEVEAVKVPWLQVSLGAAESALRGIFAEPLKLAPELRSVAQAGETAALDRLIKFLVRSGRVSPFVGQPIEWDALDDMVHRNFRKLGLGEAAGRARLTSDPALGLVVSRHFQDVLEATAARASLFHLHWELTEDDGGIRLSHRQDLGGELRVVLKGGSVVSRTLLIETVVPAHPDFRDALAAAGNNAWLLGIMEAPVQDRRNGTSQINVQFKPVAVLKLAQVPETALSAAKAGA